MKLTICIQDINRLFNIAFDEGVSLTELFYCIKEQLL